MTLPTPEEIEALPPHDNTMLNDWRHCERKYFLKHVLKRKPAVPAIALDFGVLLHVGLAEYYRQLASGRPYTSALNAAIEAMWDTPYIQREGDDYRTKERAILVMAEYAKVRQDEEEWELLMIETPFDLRLPKGYKYGGVLDLLIRDKYVDELSFVDHKSTSQFGSTYYSQYFPDSQTIGYMWAVGELHGKQVFEAIINVLAIRKSGNEFDRRGFTYLDWHLHEWLEDTQHTLDDIVIARRTNHYSVHGWQRCVTKFGFCEMFELCRADPDNRMDIIGGDGFTDNRWDWNR